MKLKLPKQLHRRMTAMARLSKLPGGVTELTARALRGYHNYGNGVALAEYTQPATRKDSTVLELNLPEKLVNGLSCAHIRAIIAWRLDEAEEKAANLPPPQVPELYEGIDYTVVNHE